MHKKNLHEDRHFDPKKRVKLAKFVLLILILGICIVGKRGTTWPIITWSVYSTYSKGFPEPTTSIIEVRVYSKTGELYLLEPDDLMPRGLIDVSEAIFNYAFISDDSSLQDRNRRYLAHTVTRLFSNVDIATIQGWKIIWNVTPFNVPPLTKDEPEKRILLGSFEVKDYLTEVSDLSKGTNEYY